VSTVKKSQANSVVACARRNFAQVGPDVRGVGSMPCRCRIIHTLEGASRTCGCRKSHPTFWRGTMHIETCRFPPPYDRCSSGTTKRGIVCLRRYDVLAHRQDRVDPLHSFNPFILFTGPDEVFGTHRVGKSTRASPSNPAVLPQSSTPRCHDGLAEGD
jgi:hypothetical protein